MLLFSYGICRTGNLKLFDCLFASCYSLNDAGRIIVLGGGICSALYRIFYFVLFLFKCNNFIYANSRAGTAGCISQSNKQEGQITYHSHSNSKVVETAEICC